VLAGSGWQAWRPLPLRLAEFGLTGLGDRAGDGSAICRPDEQIHLEADGCAAQRVHHGRPIGGAAVSGWHLRDRARSRPSWTSPCRRRRMRGKADHPRPLDRRHRAEWKRRCMGCRCLRALLSGTKDALPEQAVRGYWRGALLFALGIHGQYLFVDRRNQLVIVMMSSQADPLDAELISLTMTAVSHFREIFALSQ
jgi:CubicO group peptidase (beta-lactamase class C family)